jgi:hypothetical protein
MSLSSNAETLAGDALVETLEKLFPLEILAGGLEMLPRECLLEILACCNLKALLQCRVVHRALRVRCITTRLMLSSAGGSTMSCERHRPVFTIERCEPLAAGLHWRLST